MIIEEQVYLEHFGKKGMKWGVRNTPRKQGGGQSTAKKRKALFDARGATTAKAQKRARMVNRIDNAIFAAAVTAGTAYILRRHIAAVMKSVAIKNLMKGAEAAARADTAKVAKAAAGAAHVVNMVAKNGKYVMA